MIDQMADFTAHSQAVDEAPYIMSRYIVIGQDEELAHLYVVKGYTDQHERIINDVSVPGMIEHLSKKYIVSKEESISNFYWEVVNDI